MKTITLICSGLFLLVSTFSFGQYEKYDAYYNKITKEYTVYPDGAYDYREVKEITLNTHYAFHRLFGESFIIYNPDYQELQINECYTTMADGKRNGYSG
jgi:hypothetical protein